MPFFRSHSSPAPRVATLLALAALVAVAAGLRLYRLGSESLWLDEAFSISIAGSTFAHIVDATSEDVHPPLYYAVLNVWERVAGHSEWSGRLLSVVFSLGLLLATHAVGRRLGGRLVGLLAAGLLALSPFQIEFAQEARMYALLALLGALSTWCLIGLMTSATASPGDRPAANRWLVGYTLATAAMIYTHVYGAFVIAAHAAIIGLDLLRRRRQALPLLGRWLLACLGVVALFLPWLSIFATQILHVQRRFWVPEPDWRAVGDLVRTYAGSARLAWLLLPLAALGVARGWRAPRPAGPQPPAALVLVPWLLGPIVLPLVLSLIGSPIFLPKYTIAASVPFALLAALGLAALARPLRWAAAVGIVVLTVPALRPYYTTVHKDDWRTAVHALEARARPGDVVVFYPFFTEIPFDFYLSRHDLTEAPFPKHAELVTDLTLPFLLRPLVGDAPRVWLVAMHFDARGALLAHALAERLAPAPTIRARNIDIFAFDGARAIPSPMADTRAAAPPGLSAPQAGAPQGAARDSDD